MRVLDCRESGSTLRFFIPLALDGRGPVRFVGHGRLMQRPLDVYEEMFRPLGVRWERTEDSLTIEGSSDGDPMEVLVHDKVLMALCLVYFAAMFAILYL